MPSKKETKGKAAQRAHVTDDAHSPPPPRAASPGPSNIGRNRAQESPAPTNRSTSSQPASQSQPNSNSGTNQPTTSASSSPAAFASSPGASLPAAHFASLPSFAQVFGNWAPLAGYPHQLNGSTTLAPIVTASNMASPQNPPACPPDELGPPPPPPPPPAIPPVVNPLGVHFQPQVPGTEMGPMIHHYVPRQEAFPGPAVLYPVQQMPAAMATGAAIPMMPVQATAPINPIVIQQPVVPPVMVQNQPLPGGPPLMLPAPTRATFPPALGNPAVPGLPAQPPVHVDPAMGVGLTPNETLAQNIRIAQNNRVYEPQDFKPADPDPYRKYWLRELNGHWAVFTRRQIERINARWYRTDQGVIYAVRLSD